MTSNNKSTGSEAPLGSFRKQTSKEVSNGLQADWIMKDQPRILNVFKFKGWRTSSIHAMGDLSFFLREYKDDYQEPASNVFCNAAKAVPCISDEGLKKAPYSRNGTPVEPYNPRTKRFA